MMSLWSTEMRSEYEHIRKNLCPGPAKGSALLMSMVFLSLLSTIALAALEAAWSGQRMVSAYISHQQTFQRLERELLLQESRVWQPLDESGLEFWLSTVYGTTRPADNIKLTVYRDWFEDAFETRRCGPLFALTVRPTDDTDGYLHVSIRWEICCENRHTCMAGQFSRLRRLWSRSEVLAD